MLGAFAHGPTSKDPSPPSTQGPTSKDPSLPSPSGTNSTHPLPEEEARYLYKRYSEIFNAIGTVLGFIVCFRGWPWLHLNMFIVGKV